MAKQIDPRGDFVHLFGEVYPGDTIQIVDNVNQHWSEQGNIYKPGTKAIYLPEEAALVVYMYEQSRLEPSFALKIARNVIDYDRRKNPDAPDVHFARCVSKTFNEDLQRITTNTIANSELWRLLRPSQFQRAIGRFFSAKSHIITEIILALERTRLKTYEGTSSHPWMLVLESQINSRFSESETVRFVSFSQPIDMFSTLSKEKWIHSIIDSEAAVLVADAKSGGRLRGLISVNENIWDETQPTFAPHYSLVALQQVLTRSEMLCGISAAGDIYVMRGDGIVFRRIGDRWHYINYGHIKQVIADSVANEKVAIAIQRAVIDLSFEHKGALFCILKDEQDLEYLLSDSTSPKRANIELRKSLKGLSIEPWPNRKLIKAAATTDGATVLNRDGFVLDIACMLSCRDERWTTSGRPLKSLPGARSTAAWKGSFYGLCLKVSDDGPVAILRNGNEVENF